MKEYGSGANFGQLVDLERVISVNEARTWWLRVEDRVNFPTHVYQFFRGLVSYEDLINRHKGLPKGIKIYLCRVGINPDAWRRDNMDRSVQVEIYLGNEVNSRMAPSSRDGDGLHKKIPGSEKLLEIRSGIALVRPRIIQTTLLRAIEKRGSGNIIPELHNSMVILLDLKPCEEVRVGLEKYRGGFVVGPSGI